MVPLDELHAVAVVRVGTELKGFGQQSVKSFAEIDPVSRQENAADFHTQHGLASPKQQHSVGHAVDADAPVSDAQIEAAVWRRRGRRRRLTVDHRQHLRRRHDRAASAGRRSPVPGLAPRDTAGSFDGARRHTGVQRGQNLPAQPQRDPSPRPMHATASSGTPLREPRGDLPIKKVLAAEPGPLQVTWAPTLVLASSLPSPLPSFLPSLPSFPATHVSGQ